MLKIHDLTDAELAVFPANVVALINRLRILGVTAADNDEWHAIVDELLDGGYDVGIDAGGLRIVEVGVHTDEEWFGF